MTLRQAVYLTAADNFAREMRLVARPPGDHSPRAPSVSQGTALKRVAASGSGAFEALDRAVRVAQEG